LNQLFTYSTYYRKDITLIVVDWHRLGNLPSFTNKFRNILDGRPAQRRFLHIKHFIAKCISAGKDAFTVHSGGGLAQLAHRGGRRVLEMRSRPVGGFRSFYPADVVDADVVLRHVGLRGHEVVEQLPLQAGIAWKALQTTELRVGVVVGSGGLLGHEGEVLLCGVLQERRADRSDHLRQLIFQFKHGVGQLWRKKEHQNWIKITLSDITKQLYVYDVT